jgi:hypothetical protein
LTKVWIWVSIILPTLLASSSVSKIPDLI